MSDFVHVIAVGALPPGQATEVTVNGESVALFNLGGEFHALSNRCPHRGGPLGQALVDGAEVICPWHNLTFDVTSGENTTDPAMRVSRHTVKVEDGQVFVRLGGAS